MRYLITITTAVLLLAGPIGITPAGSQVPPMKFVPPGETVPSLGNSHIEKITDPHMPYNSVPPTSGPHLHEIAGWGISKTPVPDELQVHNLEDGGVMIQYNCTDCDELIAHLEKYAAQYNRVIVAPYPRMKTRIALTAWGRIATMDEPDDFRIERFSKAYMGMDHHPR